MAQNVKVRELKLISQWLSVSLRLNRAPSRTEKNVREASLIIDMLWLPSTAF